MKKMISILLLISFLFTLTSCGNRKSFLDIAVYDEHFQGKNEILFPNSECEHMEVYTTLSDPWDSNLYHMSKCKFGNCDYVSKKEAHTFVFQSDTIRGIPAYKENGYLYHEFGMYCRDCNAWIKICVLCQTQDLNCGRMTDEYGVTYHTTAHCFVDADYQELFRDTPYHIIVADKK